MRRERWRDSINVLLECCVNEGRHDPDAYKALGDSFTLTSLFDDFGISSEERCDMALMSAEAYAKAASFAPQMEAYLERRHAAQDDAEELMRELKVVIEHPWMKRLSKVLVGVKDDDWKDAEAGVEEDRRFLSKLDMMELGIIPVRLPFSPSQSGY